LKTLKAIKAAKLHVNQALVLGFLWETPGMTTLDVHNQLGGVKNLSSQLLRVLLQREYIRVESINLGLRQFINHYYLTEKGEGIAKQFTYETTIPH